MTNIKKISTNEDINDNFNINTNKHSILYNLEKINLYQTLDIYKLIDTIFWKLSFNPFSKGTYFLKYAIYLAYINPSLLYNNKKLIEIISNDTKIDSKNIRALIDNTIYSMYKNRSSKDFLSILFPENYDNQKITVKYFILVFVNYLNEITENPHINMYDFI